MDYALFIIVIIILVVLVIYLQKDISKQKEKYKKDAYSLLKESNPSPRNIKETIKGLHRYAGLRRRDEEATQLIKRLEKKIDQISE